VIVQSNQKFWKYVKSMLLKTKKAFTTCRDERVSQSTPAWLRQMCRWPTVSQLHLIYPYLSHSPRCLWSRCHYQFCKRQRHLTRNMVQFRFRPLVLHRRVMAFSIYHNIFKVTTYNFYNKRACTIFQVHQIDT
jgi:hypothetical protein